MKSRLARGDAKLDLATPADIPELHRVRTSVLENRLADPSRIQPEDYREMLTERGRGWKATVNGVIVGFAVADRERANVWALFVDPPAEGLGLGRRLHDTMMDWLFAAGVERAWLGTDPGTRAERFYRAAGWSFAGSEPNGEARFEMPRERWLARHRSD